MINRFAILTYSITDKIEACRSIDNPLPTNYQPAMALNPLTPENLPAATRFLSRLNSLPEHNICYIGLTETEISAELSVVLPPEGYGLLDVDERGQVAGFLGVEMDTSLGRAWLIGPFVETLDWQTLADDLYQAALQSLPGEINDLELCGRPENARLEEFAARHGFTRSADAALLSLSRPAETDDFIPAPAKVAFLDTPDQIAAYLPALSALHDALFPKTYYAAVQLLAMSAEEEKRLIIALVNGDVAGYIFLQARPASRDANIDFLGVAEP